MRLFILFHFFIALCFNIVADAIASDKLIISSKVKKVHTQALKNDLILLNEYPFDKEADEQTLSLLGLEKLNGKLLSEWLQKRVRYIVDEKALKPWKIILGKNIFVADKNHQFENPLIFPIIEQSEQDNNSSPKEGMVVMANVGAMLYYMGKQQGQLLGIKVKKRAFKSYKVPASSPRSGILQIGKGLFAQRLLINKKDPDAISNSLFRISTLFHEARHSDGNKTSLGFFHALCPDGHDYAGVHACDRNTNGPYAVGAQVLKELTKNCQPCDETEKAALKIYFLDSKNRILSGQNGESPIEWDPRPEGKVLPRL